MDPLTASYPWYTPYQFAGNSPISNIDLDGLEEFSFHLASVNNQTRELKAKNENDVEELQQIQKDQFIAGVVVNLPGMFVGGGVGLSFLRNNWVNLLYNPIVHNEIAAGVYGLVADDEWPIPTVGAKAARTTKYFLRKSNSVEILRELVFEKGASFANNSERKIVSQLLDEGRNVTLLAEKEGGGRAGDFLIDGSNFEFKSISDVSDISSDNLSKQIARRIGDSRKAGGQAENLIIDLTDQAGASLEIAERGVYRALGNSTGINQVRIIGDGFDKTIINKNYTGDL